MKVGAFFFGALVDAGVGAVFSSIAADPSVLRAAEAAGLRAVTLPTPSAAWEAARVYGRATGGPGVVLASDLAAAPDRPGVLLDEAARAGDALCDLLAAAVAGPAVLTLTGRIARSEYEPPASEADPHQPEPLPQDAIDEAALLLSLAARPVIWAGDGAVRARAGAELTAVAELLGAPVITGISGKGAISEAHPLCVGAVFGAREVARLVGDCDAAVAVGTSFSARSTRGGQLPMPLQLFHIDLDPAVANRRFPARSALTGDARAILAALAERLRTKTAGNQLADPAATAAAARDAARERLRTEAGAAAAVIDALRAAIPAEVTTVWDVATARWAVPLFPVPVPGTFHAPADGAAAGSSLAALAGAAAGGRGPAVAVLTSDEILLRSGDLAGVARGALPAVIVVVKGDAWASPGQKSPVRSVRPSGVGAAFGLATITTDMEGLAEAVATALASPRPALVTVAE